MGAVLRGSVQTLGSRAREVAAKVLADVVEAGAEDVLVGSRIRWPVRTGRSRAGLRVVRAGDVVQVVGTAPYTTAVHGGESWGQLVVQPVAVFVRDEAPREAGVAVVRALRVTGG